MIGLVGSVARGEATSGSDLDVLVRFANPKGRIATIALQQELKAALGCDVDLLTEATLSPHLRDRMMGHLLVLHEAG